jgi:hypothetical protein
MGEECLLYFISDEHQVTHMIRNLMAKYITLATCNCGQSGTAKAKEFVSCIQAHVHVYSCLGQPAFLFCTQNTLPAE